VYKIGWFSTGRGQGSLNLLNAIVKAIKDGTVNADISYVFCSREPGDAEGSDRYIKQVKEYGLNLKCFSSKKFKPELRKKGKKNPDVLNQWRLDYDRGIVKLIGGLGVDIIILAGYMLVVGGEMCTKYDMINLHPAAPGGPTGTWQEVIWQLIEQKAESSGNMMHLVIEELDKGPPVTYSKFPIKGENFDYLWNDLEKKIKDRPLNEIQQEEGVQNPLFSKIREESAKREIPLVIQTVKAFAEGRVRLEDKKIIAEGKVLQGPYCLTEDIEKYIKDINF
jgi:phosphoribosylglycinamide formyltransferase-1